MNSARGRPGLGWVLYRIDPSEEPPDRRIWTEHPDLALDHSSTLGPAAIGGLNTAAEARYERRRDSIDRAAACLIGHDGRLVNRNKNVVVGGRKRFDDPGRVVEAGRLRQAKIHETIWREGRRRNAAGGVACPGGIESNEGFAAGAHGVTVSRTDIEIRRLRVRRFLDRTDSLEWAWGNLLLKQEPSRVATPTAKRAPTRGAPTVIGGRGGSATVPD